MSETFFCPACPEGEVDINDVWGVVGIVTCPKCGARLRLETDTVETEYGHEEIHFLVRAQTAKE